MDTAHASLRPYGTILCLLFLLLSVDSALAGGKSHCPADDVRYEVIELGNFGARGGGAVAINERGQVTGAASLSGEVGRAFIWDCENGMANIGALADSDFASAGIDINDFGQIVGQSFSADTVVAFLWDRRNGMRAIGEHLPFNLNNWGDVALNTSLGLVIWNEATGSTVLAEVAGIAYREAFVNNLRQLGGYGVVLATPEEDDRFLIWSALRGVRSLGPEPEGAIYSFVRDFNDRGDFLGVHYLADATMPYIVKRDGSITWLATTVAGTHVEAAGFNNRRQVLGARRSGANAPVVFVWDPANGFRDLNVLAFGRVPADTEPRINSASDINEWGWIAGSAAPDAASLGDPALIVPVPKHVPYYRNLARLRGPALCRALTSLKVRAASAAVACHRE